MIVMMSKKVLLKSIITPGGISSGYSFRGRVQGVPDGNLRVVQLKDMEHDYSSIGSDCTLVDGSDIREKYYLEVGDILFISKGTNNYASVFKLDDGIPTVASSVFYVIKVDSTKADPYYISWLINAVEIQHYIQANATGTYS